MARFLTAARDANLFVIWRFGPYVCAEWPGGGLPDWLKTTPGLRTRTNNSAWYAAVETWGADHWEVIEPFLAKHGGPVIMSQIENEYNCASVDAPYCVWMAGFIQKLSPDIAWGMCGHVVHVANGTIHTGNGCPHNLGPGHLEVPGVAGKDPAMYTEDEQWFDLWGAPQTARATEDVAYGVASYLATGGSMHNYYMFHGGNHYGNWSTAAQHGRSSADVDSSDPPEVAATSPATTAPPSLGGPTSNTNTVRYANSAPLHADGSRNEPRFSHLGAMHRLFRAYAAEMLTSTPHVSSGSADQAGLQVVSYASVVFAMNNNPLRNQSVTAKALFPDGSDAFLPGQSLVAFTTSGAGHALLFNTSAPHAVAEPAYVKLAADLSWSSWTDEAGTWHRATVALTPTGNVTILLDLHGMASGRAFVNGKHVANYNLALANCSMPRPDRCGASPVDTAPGDDGDGGCDQPSQRYYHVPPEALVAGAADSAEVLLLDTGVPVCCGLHTGCKPCGNAPAGHIVIDPTQVRVVSKRTGQSVGVHVSLTSGK